jgi:hypothetical protein
MLEEILFRRLDALSAEDALRASVDVVSERRGGRSDVVVTRRGRGDVVS